jgi:hypothetical protein
MKQRRKQARAKPSSKKPATEPRTFEEVRAANLADPFHAARIHRAFEMGDRFDDQTAKSDDPAVYEVSCIPTVKAAPIGSSSGATATAAAT